MLGSSEHSAHLVGSESSGKGPGRKFVPGRPKKSASGIYMAHLHSKVTLQFSLKGNTIYAGIVAHMGIVAPR